MNTENPIKPICGNNLSEAWAMAFVKCCDSHGRVLAPGIVSFPVFEDQASWDLENNTIRNALERQLDASDIRSVNQSNVETVAGTIFPESIWKRCADDREKLFDKYDDMWPLIRNCKENIRGTYFRRLTSFGENGVNQLKTIILYWKKRVRRHSALQAGVFDPTQDHRPTPFLGFPCLQQVVFHPIGPNGSDGMKVVAFYANQLILEKAYGNYLGLYRLGKFMAGEMGLILRGVTCIASNLSLSYKIRKCDCGTLLRDIKKELNNAN